MIILHNSSVSRVEEYQMILRYDCAVVGGGPWLIVSIFR